MPPSLVKVLADVNRDLIAALQNALLDEKKVYAETLSSILHHGSIDTALHEHEIQDIAKRHRELIKIQELVRDTASYLRTCIMLLQRQANVTSVPDVVEVELSLQSTLESYARIIRENYYEALHDLRNNVGWTNISVRPKFQATDREIFTGSFQTFARVMAAIEDYLQLITSLAADNLQLHRKADYEQLKELLRQSPNPYCQSRIWQEALDIFNKNRLLDLFKVLFHLHQNPKVLVHLDFGNQQGSMIRQLLSTGRVSYNPEGYGEHEMALSLHTASGGAIMLKSAYSIFNAAGRICYGVIIFKESLYDDICSFELPQQKYQELLTLNESIMSLGLKNWPFELQTRIAAAIPTIDDIPTAKQIILPTSKARYGISKTIRSIQSMRTTKWVGEPDEWGVRLAKLDTNGSLRSLPIRIEDVKMMIELSYKAPYPIYKIVYGE